MKICWDNLEKLRYNSMSGSSIETVDNSTTNVYDRKFVNPGVTPFPQTNGFFTSPTPDSSFRSIKDLLKLFASDNPYVILFDTQKGALDENIF